MFNKTRNQLILLGITTCFGCIFNHKSSANELSLPLNLETNLTKKIYNEGEPIILVLLLKNVQSSELTVAEPLVWEGFVKIFITGVDGKEPNIPKLVYDLVMPPVSYGFKLKPSDESKVSFSLNEYYPYGFIKGSYELQAIYDTSKLAISYPNIWHGIIEGSKIKFQVKEPSIEEKKSYELLKSANEIIINGEKSKYSKARSELSELLQNEPNSVYAPYAAYLIGKSYFVMQADKSQHFAEASQYFEGFLKKFPKYPYYADFVRTIELPFSLKKQGQKEKAEEVLKKAPEGYYKRRAILSLDK